MNEDKAREILKDSIRPDEGLRSLGWYVDWTPGEPDATLDGQFTADDLEAIALWMRRVPIPTKEPL